MVVKTLKRQQPRSASSLSAFWKRNDLAAVRHELSLNALRREDNRERTAFARNGLNFQARAMAGEDVFDYGETQPGAAGFA